jgi:uncharacterized integral membrane protein
MASIHAEDGSPTPAEGFPLPRAGDESRRTRAGRHTRRARLYTWAALLIASLVVLILLIAANTHAVKLDWVIGSTHASLVWIILAAGVLGWLLGIATAIVFRYRTRLGH